MTPAPDTSPEAVEAMIENLGKRGRKTGWLANPDGPEAAAMLRAVASERDALSKCVAAADRLVPATEDMIARVEAAEAETAALREALREIEALEIDWRLSTAENMRAASDIARRAIKENHDGL